MPNGNKILKFCQLATKMLDFCQLAMLIFCSEKVLQLEITIKGKESGEIVYKT